MNPDLLLSALEFVDQPDLGIERIHVAYQWDLAGNRPPSLITTEDINAWTLTIPPHRARAIDLEPTPDYPNLMLYWPGHVDMAIAYEKTRGADRALAAASSWMLNAPTSFYNFPYMRDFHIEAIGHLAIQRAATSAMIDLQPTTNLEAIAIDWYHYGLPLSTWASDYALALNLNQARRFGEPLQIWMSPNPLDGGKTFDLEVEWMAEHLSYGEGDRIVIWMARTKANATGQHVPITWNEDWTWVAPLRRLIG